MWPSSEKDMMNQCMANESLPCSRADGEGGRTGEGGLGGPRLEQIKMQVYPLKMHIFGVLKMVL